MDGLWHCFTHIRLLDQIPTQAEVLAMARGQGASTLAKILLRIVDAPARAAAQPTSEAFADGFWMFVIRNI